MNIVDGSNYVEEVKELIIEYTKRLGRDLSFQSIDDELKDPLKKYSNKEGRLLVATDDNNKVMGMVAFHKYSDTVCEMKRLFVKPEYRGMKIGERLIDAIINSAKEAGYKEMVLDTIRPLKSAIYLYKKHGFIECEPYYDNPMDDVIYMKKELSK